MSNRIHRAELIDEQFKVHVQNYVPRTRPSSQIAREDTQGLADADLVELFDSQLKSRQLDLMARKKRQENKVFYTIGSSGHEGNALLGRLSRPTDPAFLHYRSGAFMAERYRHQPSLNFIKDTCLSFAASKNDPSSGGRHKVWGHPDLWVLPQTSTIASQLPKALGMALGIESASGIPHTLPIPGDSLVLCSFGDASFNHATAQTALNAAAWTRHQNLRCPIVFVCEDNGWGISVPTPTDYIEQSVKHRYGIDYFKADGLDLEKGHASVQEALRVARSKRRPVFLHLKTVRLMGHAGTDFEIEYRNELELVASERQDPLLRSAELVIDRGLMDGAAILSRYKALHQECLSEADVADQLPRLTSRSEIMAPLGPLSNLQAIERAASLDGFESERQAIWGGSLPEDDRPTHMAIMINYALRDLLIKYPQAIVFGEDVAKKGGVYTITKKLWSLFGRRRVFNTLLDETTILGLAQGYGSLGYLPVPEIQYLAYIHNALDQIRGEACSLQFFSNDKYRNPMVIRIAGLGYQKGFGGHFHNDNSLTALRDIPGLVIGVPSRGDDAVCMLRSMMAMAHLDGRVCAMVEPIALYMRKDLSSSEDRRWCFQYPKPQESLPLSLPRVYGEDEADLAIITYGNGVLMALGVQQRLEELGHRVKVIDLRWIKPLPLDEVCSLIENTHRILVADEGRPGGSIGESVVSGLAQRSASVNIRLLTSPDSYIPLGAAAEVTLLSEAEILDAAHDLLKQPAS